MPSTTTGQNSIHILYIGFQTKVEHAICKTSHTVTTRFQSKQKTQLCRHMHKWYR